MPDDIIKENPTLRLQKIVKKRDTKKIITKQNQFRPNTRRNRSGGFTAEVYSSFDED